MADEAAAFGCPHHLQTTGACRQEKGNIIAPAPPPSLFDFSLSSLFIPSIV
jgi:hypothetical protein